MLAELVKETNGLLDRRFVLNSLLPSLIVVGLLGLVVVTTLSAPTKTLESWNRLDGTLRVLLGTGIVLVTVLVSAVLSGQTQTLIRCYEGYWPGRVGRLLATWGSRWHRRRLRRLNPADPLDYERIHRDYPLPTRPEEVLPTRLGNILKNAELHPSDRYGVDAVLIWPRLFPLLPDKVATSLAAAKAEVEFQLTISALAGVFCVVTGSYLVAISARWWVFLLCFWGGAFSAWAAYLGALGPARLYGQQIKVAFDLYRRDLLTHLGLPLDDPAEEPRHWQRLAQLWYRNVPAAVLDLPDQDDKATAAPERLWPALPLGGCTALIVLLTGLAIVVFVLGWT